MKILFIRHGETTDNLRHVYAGVTDSSLTSHGVLQAARLATHLTTAIPPATHIFASPLSRARKTAEAIHLEQKKAAVQRKRDAAASSTTDTGAAGINPPDVQDSSSGGKNGDVKAPETEAEVEDIYFKIDPDLIEQDFGSHEGETFLAATPKKKRKRSASAASLGDFSRKRRAADENGGDGLAGGLGGGARTDVEMTAGEEGPLTGRNIEDGGSGTKSVGGTPSKLPPTSVATATVPEEDEEEEEDEDFREMETVASIKQRADSFVRRCIIPLLPTEVAPGTTIPDDSPPRTDNPVVVIVSHGILLGWLWKSFVALFPASSVLATTPVVQKGWYQGKHPGWGNTGYLAVEVLPKGVVGKDGMTVVIEGVNEKVHLVGLKRTGGGVGSAQFDEKQMKLEGFFGKKEAAGSSSSNKQEEGKDSKL